MISQHDRMASDNGTFLLSFDFFEKSVLEIDSLLNMIDIITIE